MGSSSHLHAPPFQAGKYIIDSGSPITIVPVGLEEKGKASIDSGLRDASGNQIRTFGKTIVTVPINGEKYSFPATQCDVVRPILGRDFFRGPGKDMLLDICNSKIVKRSKNYSCTSPVKMNDSNVVCALDTPTLNSWATTFVPKASLE
ncbi:Hypothetical predicted protein, partial [Paramuricea clavata]